ncbi:hypothetical protein CDL15_Pgr003133 [Punica granatum]|uniref:DNA helicase n=1 Tax=Punica granatum TaxID=22663 RepID=A0A218X3N7_PUNGR|nr:hypothetical protein CDL15_Pgr003133 [Punica granatum]
MASKGPRSKLDHETRARRQKALEAPREPRRPKSHWDHVLEEMVWLSKDFESERKWKLAQAKRVALRASKGMLDQATRGERKLKEEEHRLRKVLYKHQMELDVKKKKALDKQLEFLLGQTERYSTMLAENLVDVRRPLQQNNAPDSQMKISDKEADEVRLREEVELEAEPLVETADDDDFDLQTEDESEDDEHTIEEDEALITAEERQEELEALQNEMDVPLEELLERYAVGKGSRQTHPGTTEDAYPEPPDDRDQGPGMNLCSSGKTQTNSSTGRRCAESNGSLFVAENHVSEVMTCQANNHSKSLEETGNQNLHYDFHEEQEDGDFVAAGGEEKLYAQDDEGTLSEEEELARAESYDPMDELALLQKESEIPVEELIARYKKDLNNGSISEDESDYASALSEDLEDTAGSEHDELRNQDVYLSQNAEVGGGSISHSSPEEEQETDVGNESEVRESDSRIADAAAAARSAQPTGNTFLTTKVRTKFPFLLKHPLREYQHIGLDWLVTMYEKRLNGILADEMGLGKTIMTIALLAHLACEKGIWGPHLIVVPTSVMLNWETEFLKWCPAFKILTYFGSAKERRFKRQGWLKPNSFHVCITTYRLVIQDSKIFKRKKWKYLILDEAHLIKNWKSQRWQTLLNFHSKRRILLTGTPLQNDLMELWSLMHFLMPHIFQSHQEFKDWFCNPISGMVEGQEKVNKEVVDRLHNVLRPFILRRLKRDVEKQLPMKHEHVIYCRLSRRQRNLYEDFIASSETQATLASANFFGMISVIMQLRKVCNHPDLFEGRPIISSFDMSGIDMQLSSSVCSVLSNGPFTAIDLQGLGLLFTHLDFCMASWESDEVRSIETPSSLIIERVDKDIRHGLNSQRRSSGMNIFEEIQKAIQEERLRKAEERAASIAWWNSLRCRKKPMYPTTLREIITIRHPVHEIHQQKASCLSYSYSSKLADIVLSPVERFERMIDVIESFMFAIPAARAPEPVCWCSKSGSPVFLSSEFKKKCSETFSPLLSPIRPAIVRRQVYFPDRRLIQFDCGKLQELAILLRKLKSEGHRALIFTQMTKMLDVLEAFISLYGYTYMRLDGSTQPEERQTLMQRFNTNPKIFLFILSTRSGGVGINLVGADTVIFYDSDWNPAMDQQAQDRCHRIGQTREVHIYRLISESTIEENILKKANQKRALDDLVIQSGGYNTEFFKKLDPMELFSGHRTLPAKNMQREKNESSGSEVSPSNADVEAALKQAEDEADYMALKRVEQEEAVDNQEFTEEPIGRMEDDDFVNEDDLKDDEPADHAGGSASLDKETGAMINSSDFTEGQVLTLAEKEEEDVDMLADVRQMAEAAAASGQAISSFENQLRPIDRYAIRFFELWDPIIDKATLESQIKFEETEWELDRIEKYKEDMEAEIDDDEEPFIYERWDTDFATEAYRQQVEALAQHQLMEELAMEAKEKEKAEAENCDEMSEPPRTSKSKSKKKAKKAKFKSLKKGSLASEAKPVKEEPLEDSMYLDDDGNDVPFSDEVKSLDAPSPHSPMQKKRKDKPTENSEGQSSKKKLKKQRTASVDMFPSDPDCHISGRQHSDSEYEQKTPIRNRASGKFSIAMLPSKRSVLIKVERFKKTDFWPRDRIPPSDPWWPQEDAILCAGVHEYGPNWGLISDLLYGMASGGSYRGRYRHPVHCSERFRELIQNYIMSASDNPNSEKTGSVGSGKALFRVTEDNIRLLLDVASELPDKELLLQRHFTALLSSVWMATNPVDRALSLLPSKNSLYFGGRLFSSHINHGRQNSTRDPPIKVKMIHSAQSRKLLSDALHDAIDNKQKEIVCLSDNEEEVPCMEEGLQLTLEIPQEEDDSQLPSVLNLSIPGSYRPPDGKDTGEDHLKTSKHMAESRFREASCACLEGSLGWASSAFPTNDAKSRAGGKPQILGKHKPPLPDLIKPSKSKSRKTNSGSAQTGDLIYEAAAHDLIAYLMPPPASPLTDPNLKFDFVEPTGAAADDSEDNLKSLTDEDLLSQIENSESVPHDYDPGLLSGLDDYSSLPEYTDVG